MPRLQAIVFRIGGVPLEFNATRFSETVEKRVEYRPLTGGREFRLLSADAGTMRRSGKRRWDMSFEGVPPHFRDTLERIHVFEVDSLGQTPIEMRTSAGTPEDDYTLALIANSVNVPSGTAARLHWYFPQRGLVSGTVRVFRNEVEIGAADGTTPYTVNHGSGLVVFNAAVAAQYVIAGRAEYAVSGQVESMETEAQPGYVDPPRHNLRLVFRES